jgi:CHAT domain-containing protein
VLRRHAASPLPRPLAPWLAGAALACILAGCEAAAMGELPDALEGAPGVAPRLSAAPAFRACTEQVPAGGTIPRASCPSARPRTDGLAQVARRAAQAKDDPAAQHTLALLDVVASEGQERALERSVTSLRRLAARSDRPAAVLADLAAALIVRAEHAQAPRDLLEAYGAAEDALRHDPRHPPALYNAALALDRIGLVDEGMRAWRAYLAVDARSGWADEGRRRLAALQAVAAPRTPPAEDASPRAYETWAAAEPEGARELAMDRLLGAWGTAAEAGDTIRAARLLERAAAVGAALARRPGGDASVADAVAAIRSTRTNPGALLALARAHRDFAAGRAAFEAVDFAGAEPRLAAAATTASAALRSWARLHHATTLIQLRRGAEAIPILERSASADAARYPALVGRARYLLARSQAQGDSWERALAAVRAPAALFARAGERENEGAALASVAEAHFVFGETDSAYTTLHRGLERLRGYRGSPKLHNLLLSAAEHTADDGQIHAAIRLQDEGVAVASRQRRPLVRMEALLARARLHASANDAALARADVDSARAIIHRLGDESARLWARADMWLAEGIGSLRDDPRGATEALDSAAVIYASLPLFVRTLPALIGAAEARLAAGDAAGSVQRLQAAVRLLDQRRDSLRMEPRRAAVFDAARGVVDRLVLLTLAQGRPAQALEHMDRARASLAAAGGPAADEGGGVEGPPGEVAVEYARVADTLLVWTVEGRTVEVSRTVLDTVQFIRTLAVLEDRLQGRAGDAEVRPALASLYDWLIRPVRARLGRPETPLVIIADGEIAAVPFAALYDARRGRHLLHDHPLRFAVSLREARRAPPAAPAGGTLLVADPAFDRRRHPLLEPLPYARAEVRTIARGYPGASLLEGSGATRAALEPALARAGMIHFSGHAVFDDERPEQSHLVLAPLAGRDPAGRITAAELAALDLRHVRLVVLSACRTVRGGSGRAAGFTGLSGALLAAGAGGTVASTWDVDERSTAALMAEFHRAYARDGRGPAALRSAQLALLRSPDPALRTPAAWAAFRYTGR